jgi:nitrogen fixation NifU-like protein
VEGAPLSTGGTGPLASPDRSRYEGGMSASSSPPGPRRLGRLERPDGVAEGRNECGDVIEITLAVRDGRVQRASVAPQCCMTTLACALAAAAMAEGKTPAEVLRDVQPEAVAAAVGGLPDDHFRCAVLAADTLRRAVADHLRNSREPWRRLYRT